MLKQYTPEIFAIAKANEVDTGVGMDMFLANIRNHPDKRLPFYKGADNVDYESLKPHLTELIRSKTEFSAFVRKNYDELTSLFNKGEYNVMRELVSK